MIGPAEQGVPEGKERVEEFEGLRGARLDEVVPGELPGWKVAGVELGELAYVERDALFGFGSTNHSAMPDGVLALVFGYDVVLYVEYERFFWGASEVAQGRFDVDQAQHLVGVDAGLHIGALEVGV